MRTLLWKFRTILFFGVIALAGFESAGAQTLTAAHLNFTRDDSLFSCERERSLWLTDQKGDPALRVASDRELECDARMLRGREAAPGRNSVAADLSARISREEDPVESRLASLGEYGRTIDDARNEVLAIFETDNSCSGWYLRESPDARAVFRSLYFVVDSHGSNDIVKAQGGLGGWVFVHPYVARVGQSVSPGSEITLNANGAFFQRRAPVRLLAIADSIGFKQTQRVLVVGPYDGGTIRAQVLTLLHEFGHVMNLLPVDAAVPNGPEISTRNTREVLLHCKPEIDASGKP